jgi:serine/threonine-protein kinase
MSPEQMQSSRDVDERTDIWALGVSLYELCTGVGPFEAPSLREVCVRVLAGQPAPPRSLRPELSPGLEAVILRCLQKDREGRYATIAALRSALLPFSSSALVTPLPSAPPPAYAQAPGLPAASASPWGAAPSAAAPSASPYAAPNASPYAAAPSASPYAAPSASPYAAAPQASPFAAPANAAPSAGAAPRLAGLPLPLVIGAGALLVLTIVLAFVLGRGHGGADAEGASSAAPGASAPAGTGRYQIEAELIVDGKTGLRWQRRPPLGTMSFSAAKSYCASARGNGFRLPTQEELALLARAARQNLSAPSEVFHSLASDYFWTGSTVEQDPKLYWIVRAGDGDATTSSPSGVARVRCVR